MEYIHYIHGFLCEICKESGCEGVEFYGGPEVKCDGCDELRILCCVLFDELAASDCVECPFCQKSHDVNKLLVSYGAAWHL